MDPQLQEVLQKLDAGVQQAAVEVASQWPEVKVPQRSDREGIWVPVHARFSVYERLSIVREHCLLLGLTPHAVVNSENWSRFLKANDLYELQLSDDCVLSEPDLSKICEKADVQARIARSKRPFLRRFNRRIYEHEFGQAMVAELKALSDEQKLQMLWPKRYSPEPSLLGGQTSVTVTLPTSPEIEQALGVLQRFAIPAHVVASSHTISLSARVSDVLLTKAPTYDDKKPGVLLMVALFGDIRVVVAGDLFKLKPAPEIAITES